MTTDLMDVQVIPDPVAGPPVRGSWRLRVGLLALAAALATSGTVFLARAHHAQSSSATQNQALVNASETREAISAVSTELNQVLSYSFADLPAAQATAKRWLVGDAMSQFQTLFTNLQQLAPGQKLDLVAKVVTGGVTSLHGNTAQLLVFLDQMSTRESDKKSSVSAAQVQITAVKSGTTWHITELKPL